MQPPGPSPMDHRYRLPVGTVLDQTYEIEGELGAGGFGITYRGRDRTLGHAVAIKEYFPAEIGNRDATMSIHPASAGFDPAFKWGRDGFLREAKMLAGFRHPGIVRVLRYFEANNTAYMVLEFEEGRSLAWWLKTLGRAPTQLEMDQILRPLCSALSEIHGRRLVHRDIAPDNIIVRPDGSPVLLDFGAARHEVAEQTRLQGRPVPTISYAIVKAHYSPIEQRSTDTTRRGPWSDVYALGATLYRAVTGAPPPDATDRMAGDGDLMVPAREAARASYRASFLSAIDRALALRPADRPQSIRAFEEMAFAETPDVSIPKPEKEATLAPERATAARARSFTEIQDQRPPDQKPPRKRSLAIAAVAGLALFGAGAMAVLSGVGTGPNGRAALVGTESPPVKTTERQASEQAALENAATAARAAAERQAAADRQAEQERLAREQRQAEERATSERQAREAAAAAERADVERRAAAEAEATRIAAVREEARRAEQRRADAELQRLREESERLRADNERQRLAAAAATAAQAALPVEAARTADVAPAARIERRQNVYLDGEGFETTLKSTYELCEARCLAEPRCAALELYKPEAKCNLFEKLGPTKASKDADVGVKVPKSIDPPTATPRPDANAPVAAAVRPSRIVRTRNRFFEGDGYRRITGTTYHNCERVCLGDDRCRAIELHRKGNICQLYDKTAKTGPTQDADIGVKQ